MSETWSISSQTNIFRAACLALCTDMEYSDAQCMHAHSTPFLTQIERIKSEKAVLDIQKQDAASIPLEEESVINVLKPERVYIPLGEKELQTLKHNSISQKDESHQKSHKKKFKRHFDTKSGPLTEAITAENQYERLAEVITPLCKMQYHKQLRHKHNRMSETMRIISRRLKDVHAPFQRNKEGHPCPLEHVRPSGELCQKKCEFCFFSRTIKHPKDTECVTTIPTSKPITVPSSSYLYRLRYNRYKFWAVTSLEFLRQSADHPGNMEDQQRINCKSMLASTTSCTVVTYMYHITHSGSDTPPEVSPILYCAQPFSCPINYIYLQ
ncbi:unnamed protein product, partial [Meganyctiphanes norvegica]